MNIKAITATITFAVLTSLYSCDPAVLQGVISQTGATPVLSNEEIITGLKEALKQGTGKAVSTTYAMDGFWKNPTIRIPFPQEAINVRNTAISLGLQSKVETFEATLNHAAEKAASQATQVFIDAITQMTVQDAYNILHGDSIAATTYLKQHTTADLTTKFKPIVQQAIDQVKLTSYWEPLATAYNTANILTGNKAINPDLTGYVTEKALQGLFQYVGAEEKRIRKDPVARASEILKKVFGSVDGKY